MGLVGGWCWWEEGGGGGGRREEGGGGWVGGRVVVGGWVGGAWEERRPLRASPLPLARTHTHAHAHTRTRRHAAQVNTHQGGMRELAFRMGVERLPWFQLFLRGDVVSSFTANIQSLPRLRSELATHQPSHAPAAAAH